MTRNSQKGFTLLETMTAITLLATTLAIGVPALQSFTQKQRITQAANLLIVEMQYARSQAIMRKRYVVMCPSSDGAGCLTSGDWHQGILTFEDDNGNREWDEGETVLRRHHGLSNSVQAISSRYRKRINYFPRGFAWGSNTTIRICAGNTSHTGKAVIISNSGRPKITQTDASDNPIECPLSAG